MKMGKTVKKQDNFKTALSEIINGKESLDEKPMEKIIPIKISEEPAKVKSLTVIAEDVNLVGDIKTDGDINILGSVKGKITSKGHVFIEGSVDGNIKANTISVDGGVVVAENIQCSGKCNIGICSKIKSDIVANEIEVSGEIIGNLDIKDLGALYKTAKLDGNVTYGTLAIERGASLVGNLLVRSVADNRKSDNLDSHIKLQKSV
ncbi:MAG: polymer-forming cytoskeletal protein [Anaerovoracaceae bacterium]